MDRNSSCNFTPTNNFKRILVAAVGTLLAATLVAAPARTETVIDVLTKGIEPSMSDDYKLSLLLSNMRLPGFKYIKASTVDDLLAGKSKTVDCGALARLFVKVATDNLKIANLSTSFVNPTGKKVFVRGGSAIVDPDRGNGNTDYGKHWIFQNHVWVKHQNGKVYDPLFGLKYASEADLKNSFEIVDTFQEKFNEKKKEYSLSGVIVSKKNNGTKKYYFNHSPDLSNVYTSSLKEAKKSLLADVKRSQKRQTSDDE